MHALIAGVVYTCPSHPGAGSDGPLATEKVVRLLCVCVCVCVLKKRKGGGSDICQLSMTGGYMLF